MGKHTKRLKAEKAKVKLKKTHLPKGQNITDTAFKVRKIAIVSQLHSHGADEVLTTRKQNIKELLNSLNHHNTNHRLSGLSGLKEIIKCHPKEVFIDKLRDIMTSLNQMILDIEEEVRRSAVSLIQEIFEILAAVSKLYLLVPLYDIVSVHLNCAMTHINTNIQADSILLIETYVTHIPDMIKQNSKVIFYNFLNMISKSKSENSEERTLNLNLKSKLSGIQQRTKLFYYLYKILEIIYKKETENVKKIERNVVVDGTSLFVASIMDYNYLDVPNLSLFNKAFLDEKNIKTCDTEKQFKSHVASVMPLLHESWMEVSPKTAKIEIDSRFRVELLTYILKLLHLFWERVLEFDKKNNSTELAYWFQIQYKTQLVADLVQHFPLESVGSLDSDTSTARQNKYVKENLDLCYLYYCFNLNIPNIENSMVHYINDCLENPEVTHLNNLIELIEFILQNPKIGENRHFILSSVIRTYKSPKKQLKDKLFDVIIKVSTKQHLSDLRNNSDYLNLIENNFLKELTNKTISYTFLESLNKVMVTCEVFRRCVERNLVGIFTNLKDCCIEGGDDIKGKMFILSWVNYCQLDNIKTNLQNHVIQHLPPDLKDYLIQIVLYKHPDFKFCEKS